MGFVTGRWAASLLLAVGLTIAACGGERSPREGGDPLVWKAGPWRPALPMGIGFGHKELAVLDLPWAGDAGPDRWRWAVDAPRFVLNLEREDGRAFLYFRGRRWPLDRDPRERRLAFQNLRQELTAVAREPRLATRGLHAVVRADCRSAWREVSDTLAVLAEPAFPFTRTSFGVAAGDPLESDAGRIDADPSSADFSAALPLSWSVAAGTVLKIGTREWSFPAGDPYAAGPTLEKANANWREVLAAMKAGRAAGAGAVTMTVALGVPWAHVAQTLGLLLAADLHDLKIEGLPAWRLSTPSHEQGSPGYPVAEGRDLPPALAVGIGAALALALSGATLLLARRGRRRARPAA